MAGLKQLRNAISSTFCHRNCLNRPTRDLRFVMRDSARSFLTEVESTLNSHRPLIHLAIPLLLMLKSLFGKNSMKMGVLYHPFFTSVREMHSRNKKAAEFIAKGRSALQEVDRVIDYADIQDQRLIPLLKTAKENFELALEADNLNTSARLMLSKLHLKYHVPGACKAIGAALLVEAADMGDANAQYELGVHLRTENDHVQSDQQAFYYIQKAVDQLHPGALYLLGAVYLTGDCVQKDVASALWCFHRASQKGHTGAAIAYGSLLLRGYEVPENVTKFKTKKPYSKKTEIPMSNPIDLAKEQFEIAAKAGCDLGFKWLQRLDDVEKKLLDAQ